tara:strand:+ start:560 stop:1000 length:441 start_codon:yes stop_codon:yes gene_type:complete
MPSQIKVDEIKNVAGQYKIKTNVFEGQTTAGSITVQGEGTNTTNLQQGLLKVWIAINQDGTMATLDSFNTASITDDGTGKSDINFTTNMSSANYFNSVSAGNSNNRNAMFFSPSTTQQQIEVHGISTNSSDADATYVCGGVAGDLA